MEIYCSIIAATIITIIIYSVIKYSSSKTNLNCDIACVPGKLPFIGHNLPIITMRSSFLYMFNIDFYHLFPNSSMMGYYNFSVPGIIIRDPKLIKQIMTTEFINFSKNTSSLDHNLDPLLSTNPFFTSDDQWKKNRTILLNGLTSQKLKVIALGISSVADEFTNYLEQLITSSSSKSGAITVNALELLSRFTAQVVAIGGFGINGKSFNTEETETFESMVRPMLQPGSFYEFISIITFFFPFIAKILRVRFMPKKIYHYFVNIIKTVLEARSNGNQNPHNDFIQKVSEFCRNEETGKIDEVLVASHAASFFLDGYITSGVTLAFTAYQIAKHGEVQEKLRQHVIEILKKNDGKLTYQTLEDMKYMEQVIYESMRLFPALGYLGKVCTKETKLVGSDGVECCVKPGTEMIIPVFGLHRDQKYWDNPELFDPERFSPDNAGNLNKFVFLPFGGGPRQCVGMRVAIMQMKAALAMLVKDYWIEVDRKTDEPLRVHKLSGLFTAPHSDIWIRVCKLKDRK
ncbi:cytochrome P450 9e2-like [Cotesia glomerata]|uniref:cytochrome P450 9e2-like n=1 Tax=Cotesia glomerata TaxID=32391 RepID=UPI001D025F31|nr:cytochrome P450 9e2-like [Cotesia glomerata]